MNKIKTYVISLTSLALAFVGLIIWKFGLLMLVRLILSLGFLVATLMLGFFLALAAYAKWKYAPLLIIPTALSGYAAYLCITWQKLEIVGSVIALFLLAFIGFVWYISEPDLGFADRIKSAERLEREGKFRIAARKYERRGSYSKAGELYLKLGLLESAAWAYEKAEMHGKAAEIYESLYEKEGDAYYLKEAHELWKKAGNMERAAECLEKYSEQEPWFWEDVARMYEELDSEKAEYAWRRALEYYEKEALEEGVFWEDVARIYAKLGEGGKAKEAYRKFLEYCLKEAESDGMWWKHVAEAYEMLGEKERAEDAWRRYESYRRIIENTTCT